MKTATTGSRISPRASLRHWKRGNRKWGFIDHSGRFVIPPQFPLYPLGLVSSFSDGLAAIAVSGKLGYIDHAGKYVIAPQFVAGTAFEDGIARVVAQGPCSYFDYENFDPCLRMSARSAPATGRSCDSASAGSLCKWSFIDKTGKPIIATEFEVAMGFHEGLAAVRVGELWGFVNLQGTFAIPPTFDAVHSCSNGLALVRNGKESGFITKRRSEDSGGVLESRTVLGALDGRWAS